MRLAKAEIKTVAEQEARAQQLQNETTESSLDYQARLEKAYGLPIETERLPDSRRVTTLLVDCWNRRDRRKVHTIGLVAGEPWRIAQLFAAALAKLESECRAHQSGRRLTHFLPRERVATLLKRQEPAPDNERLLCLLFNELALQPLDMLAQINLVRSLPVFEPAAAVNLRRAADAAGEVFPGLAKMDASPQFRQALATLFATRALFVDRMFPTEKSQFDSFAKLPGANEAKRACAEIVDFAEGSQAPGDHYKLVDRIAEIAGLPGLHDWDVRTALDLKEMLELHGACGSAAPIPVLKPAEGPSLN